MLKNNILIAWRNILKHKLQTGINITGLSIGIAGCLVVFLLVKYELGFNKNIVDGDRIFRVYTQFNGVFSGKNGGVPPAMPLLAASALQGAEVQSPLHTFSANVSIPASGGVGLKKFKKQEDVVITGPAFFDLIQNFEWLAGAPASALSEPFRVVLTESKARTYFGTDSPDEILGRQIYYDDSLLVTVSGILKDPDFRSDFHFTDFISIASIPGSHLKKSIRQDDWGFVNSGDQFFIKAAEGVTPTALAANLKPLNERLNADREPGTGYNEFKLQPLSDLHFNQELGVFNYGGATAHKPTLYGLMLIAALLLIIAAINFINLTTVQATLRSRETGVRKVIGATRKQLTFQFLVETALITVLALPVAAALSELAMRYFSEFLPKELILNILSPGVGLFLLAAVVVVTFLAGLYPAFVVSSFQPAFAIKNQAGSGMSGKSGGLRKGLIVFQFVLAQAFIIGAIIIGQQLKFVMKADLGFEKDAIVYFYTKWGTDNDKKRIFQQKLAQIPEVKSTTIQNQPPMNFGYQASILSYQKNGEIVDAEVHMRMADTAYLQLYGIELLAGRNLLPSDSVEEFLINETFAKNMGYASPSDAIGQLVKYGDTDVPIAGVVKDFHPQSFHHVIPPLAFTSDISNAYAVAVKISSGQPVSASIDKFRTVFEEVFPGTEFRYHFLDETIEKLYESEMQTAKLINTASGLAILISCLGLFGLAFFSVTRRSKEISIRKILGASVSSVVAMLSKDFIWLVLVALAIAAPLAWFFMDKWLQDFAFRTKIEWWVFAVAGFAAVAVAFVTVGIQSVRAALANPVDRLRNE